MHVVVVLNLWGDVVASIVFWLFYKAYQCTKAKLVLVSNLRLFGYIISIMNLRLSLGKIFRLNFRT